MHDKGKEEHQEAPVKPVVNNQSGNSAAQAAPTFRAIEEHAKTLNVSGTVFAAVKQYKGWAAEKKTERSEFEKAVNDFLGAPIGGV